MREIFGSNDIAMVGYYKSILDAEGIPSFIRNEYAAGLSELQGPAFYPVLCVDSDDDYEAAMALLGPMKESAANNPEQKEWTCPNCHEGVPAGFDVCWNCETPRPVADVLSQ